ncbi:MAG: DUF6036 family nucleotidyltransferase [Pyrinomonadaceae bacterium]
MDPNKPIPEPWQSFLAEIDSSLDSEVAFHCFGGFAIDYLFGLPRATADVDVMSGVVGSHYQELLSLAGKGSPLHENHGVYLDLVGTVAVVPDDYESRLSEISTSFTYLKLFVMDPHDIVLSKVSRDAPQDRADVTYLAKAANLNVNLLRLRYGVELRPYIIGRTSYVDQTMALWTEMIEELQNDGKN